MKIVLYEFTLDSQLDDNLRKLWRMVPEKRGINGWLSFLRELPEVDDAQYNRDEFITTILFANEIDYTMFLLRWA